MDSRYATAVEALLRGEPVCITCFRVIDGLVLLTIGRQTVCNWTCGKKLAGSVRVISHAAHQG